MDKISTYSFCESFLDRLVDKIEQEYVQERNDLSRLAICFGGKRPALFLKRELAKRMDKSFYPPRFFTIDEFIAYTLKKKKTFQGALDLDQCFTLYKLAKKVCPEILKGRETFAQFLPWTREILYFIDQLDLELIDSQSLEKIEFNARIGYAVPDDINRLLKNIVDLREAYHLKIEQQHHFSRGFQYYKAAEVINKVSFDEFDQILFCNFFYFHQTEERIVKSLYERNKAQLIFQGDQRKWPVLERISRHFSCSLREGDEPEVPQYHLKLYSGFDAHAQVAHVREILKSIKNVNDTVIVLPDSDKIVPLLSEITTIAQEFNISMGYPLKRSSLYSLFELIFKTQLSRKEDRYYAKDYLKVLRHPFIKNLKLRSDITVTRILIHKIEEILTGKERASISGSSFIELDEIMKCHKLYEATDEMLQRLGLVISKRELRAILQNIHELFFLNWETVEKFSMFADALEQTLNMLVDKSFLKNYPLNLNIATRMLDIKDELAQAAFKHEQFPQEEVFKIFESKAAREMVSFVGSPLKGLQVLGLFETRSLNFENVIILDVNEGVLPKLNVYEPLIPREVMISLNLDRLELEEEIQRYQFMRLISSAKNVHLVYQESKDKERSRFVEELMWEEQKKNLSVSNGTPVTQASFEVKVTQSKKVVLKTPAMIKALKEHIYSASSINTYLRDPLEFYHNYVLGLREQEDLLDEPEARHVGIFIHELIEDAFKPFINKKPNISTAFRGRFQKMFDEKFNEIFGKTMKSDSFLLKSVIAERLNRFLDNEEFNEERQVDKIMHLESKFEDTIALSCGDIRFKYIIDRIDQLYDGTVMIIDYKTGSIDQMPRAIDRIRSMELSRESIFENIKSFQVPLYFYYLNKRFKGKSINAALYNLRTLEFHKFIDSKTSFGVDEINDAFFKVLDFTISEILDPNVPFESAIN